MRAGRQLRVALAAITIAGASIALEAPTTSAATGWETRSIALDTTDIVADPIHGVLYASVPSSAGASGNSVVAIDVMTGAIVTSVFGGSEPDELAISDDATMLYVGSTGSNTVRQYRLPGLQLVRSFSLGSSGSHGPRFANDLDVAPGRPDVVAVSRVNVGYSSSFEGVAVYEAGTQRPADTGIHTGSYEITFGADASLLLGTGHGFERIDVSAGGVTVRDFTPLPVSGDIQYEGGRAYTDNGGVVDPAGPTLLGTLALTACPCPFAVDTAAQRAYYLDGPTSPTLRTFDLSSLTLLDSRPLIGSGTPEHLVRWGPSSLAYTTGDGFVYITSPSTTTDLALEPPGPPTPRTYPFKLVDQIVADVVADPVRGVLYASVPANAPTRPNTVVTIDPQTATVTRASPAGSDPHQLAIADDASTLYAGLMGAGAVQQFSLPVPTSVRQIPLGVGLFGQRYPNDIAVMPGRPGTIAVARHRSLVSPPNDGVAIFDDGVQRPTTSPDHTGADRIEFASATRLFGQDTCCSGSEFYRLDVSADGVSEATAENHVLNAIDLTYADGLVVGAPGSGRVVDGATSDILGTLPVSGPLAVDAAARRVFVTHPPSVGSGGTWQLSVIDLDTYRTVRRYRLPATLTEPTTVVRWGVDGFAIVTQSGQLYLLSTDFPPPAYDPGSFGEYTAITPARVLDTRIQAPGLVPQGGTVPVRVTGVAGVPDSGVAAVVVNLTATQTGAAGYLTAWPSGEDRPVISNVNYGAGGTVPNLATVMVGSDGRINVFSSASAHVIVDVQGYYADADGPSGGRFHAIAPTRLFDTREAAGPVTGAFTPGSTRQLNLRSLALGQFSGAVAAVMNVTVTEPTTAGYLTVYPGGAARPLVSNLNFVPGQTVPNLVIVRVPASGLIDIFNSAGSTHVVADLVGYFNLDHSTEAGRFVPFVPFRVLDTRETTNGWPGGPLHEQWAAIIFDDGDASALALNVTVTQPTRPGYITAFPYPGSPPLASNVNFTPGLTVANAAYVSSPDGVGFYNSAGDTHLVIDVFGVFT